MWNKMFNSVDLLQKGLDASWLRNEVIRNNLANVETPDFKGSDVIFEETFASLLYGSTGGGSAEMKRTREKHNLPTPRNGELEAVVVENDNRSMRMDGNNVDIEDENAKLAKNSIQYNTLLYKLNSEFNRLSMAINEGR